MGTTNAMRCVDAWGHVFLNCSSEKLCQLSQTCQLFNSIAADAAKEKLNPDGFYSAALCAYLDDFGGNTCNAHLSANISEISAAKLHESSLAYLPVLSIKIFSGIVKKEVQIHGVRLLNDFFERGVLNRTSSEHSGAPRFEHSIKQLYYYEKSMSKLLDLLMLQAVLCNCFQMSIADVTQFASKQFSSSLQEQKIDGTNITQVLNSMTQWTETRSLMDKLEDDEFAIAWPCDCATHGILEGMLQTKNFDAINAFMINILNYIQGPLTFYIDTHVSKRSFAINDVTCLCELHMFQNFTQQAYICVMDLTEGHVLCSHGSNALKIAFLKKINNQEEVSAKDVHNVFDKMKQTQNSFFNYYDGRADVHFAGTVLQTTPLPEIPEAD